MSGQMKTILMGVVLVVIALILAPVVMDQIANVTGHASIADFPGTSSIANLIPLVYVVGCLFLGGFLAFKGITTHRRRKGGGDQ